MGCCECSQLLSNPFRICRLDVGFWIASAMAEFEKSYTTHVGCVFATIRTGTFGLRGKRNFVIRLRKPVWASGGSSSHPGGLFLIRIVEVDDDRKRKPKPRNRGTLKLFLSDTRIKGECADEKNVRGPVNEQNNYQVLNSTLIVTVLAALWLLRPHAEVDDDVTFVTVRKLTFVGAKCSLNECFSWVPQIRVCSFEIVGFAVRLGAHGTLTSISWNSWVLSNPVWEPLF